MMLSREKARLFVVHAELASYLARNGRLPTSLAAVGSPADPLSCKPYDYRRTGPKTYTLAAVGVPGLGRIDMSTKIPPSKG